MYQKPTTHRIYLSYMLVLVVWALMLCTSSPNAKATTCLAPPLLTKGAHSDGCQMETFAQELSALALHNYQRNSRCYGDAPNPRNTLQRLTQLTQEDVGSLLSHIEKEIMKLTNNELGKRVESLGKKNGTTLFLNNLFSLVDDVFYATGQASYAQLLWKQRRAFLSNILRRLRQESDTSHSKLRNYLEMKFVKDRPADRFREGFSILGQAPHRGTTPENAPRQPDVSLSADVEWCIDRLVGDGLTQLTLPYETHGETRISCPIDRKALRNDITRIIAKTQSGTSLAQDIATPDYSFIGFCWSKPGMEMTKLITDLLDELDISYISEGQEVYRAILSAVYVRIRKNHNFWEFLKEESTIPTPRARKQLTHREYDPFKWFKALTMDTAA